MHSAQELASKVEALLSPPTVYLRVRALLDSPSASVDELARLIAADPALTVQLLRMVNSAVFGLRGEVGSVDQAIHILGHKRVHELVLAASMRAAVAGIRGQRLDLETFWRQSVGCALAAHAIAGHAGIGEDAHMFTLGLLADIGHLVMFQTAPALTAAAHAQARERGEALHLAERRVVGCDFAEVGAALLDQWGAPAQFAAVVGAQTLPRLAGEQFVAACCLQLAHALGAAVAGGRVDNGELANEVDDDVLAALALERAQLGEIAQATEEQLGAWLAIFPVPQLL